MVPVFMRPFMTSDTVAEYIGVMQHAADTMKRLTKADELARRHSRTLVRLRGPEGPLIVAVKPPAQELELDDSSTESVDERHLLRANMLAHADAILESCREERLPIAGDQQTIHQHHFAGLTELAAFAVTTIRFVQAERQLREFLRDPEKGLNLGQLLNRPVSNNLEAGIISRARELVAAYRAAIILDVHAPQSGEASDTSADDAFKRARAFLAKFDSGTASPNDRHVMIDLDLSHWARCAPAAT